MEEAKKSFKSEIIEELEIGNSLFFSLFLIMNQVMVNYIVNLYKIILQ